MSPITFRELNIKRDWDWIRTRAHPLLVIDSCGIVAERDGVIQAVVVFDSFTRNACSMHMAIDNPFVIRAGFLHEIARYLFITRQRTRIFAMVPGDNEKALKLDYHIGLKEITRIPNGYAEGVDYVIVGMSLAECRWLLPQHFQEAANG